ncbi:MAG: hypothetical protein ACD_81C00184G0004 [uncultured bacterium]|uniref:Type IV pilus assembly protein PilM n=2 Tax=Candidatus Wolfeibacteriota TaxID=1752735 RepID=A0A0G1H6Z9_9BACT|nr:MAG: hypothetical protein ACD_81C00184G0004 [uncultured bacterium]KKR12204.1 MAG: hypothetical protein UT41_C0003G0131 [Candidatus Wolfebacteria bacterium GW2011_GWC2_39_22]KKT42575.1 MAG: hypothetical protein UW32_C0005G0011 [Candidatus Wolfebacteria bacterium GW2011_GWE2_44_13]HBI25180.1 hypothetical protein [Candidatus Wolfebacteria bacterium]
MDKAIIKKIIDTINPPVQIGGLEASDSYIRYVSIKGKKADFVSAKLEPGIIEDGKIKDKEKLFGVLASFHDQMVGKEKRIWTIASISDSNVYTEMFMLPKSTGEGLKEAAQLNLQMISPIDFNLAHADWHQVGEREVAGVLQSEILGAFVPKQFIEEFEQIADRAGFEIAAIEFPMLALTRAIVELSDQFDKKKNYLVFRLGSDGISFGLVKNGELYFLHFVGWATVYGTERRATLQSLKKMIVDEIHKVLSFYETHWEGTLTDLFLVTPTFEKEIKEAITENFPNLRVEIPNLPQFKELSIGWFSVLGSAFRGIIPRDADTMVSLATAKTRDKYELHQMTNFVRLWRNVVVTVLGGVFLLLIGLDIFLGSSGKTLAQKLADTSRNPAIEQLDELQKEANIFNQKIDSLARAQQERLRWSGFFEDMQKMAGSDIVVKRILIESIDAPVTIFGESAAQPAIGEFKKALEANPKLSEVRFQLSSVSQAEGGKFSFSMSFKIVNL